MVLLADRQDLPKDRLCTERVFRFQEGVSGLAEELGGSPRVGTRNRGLCTESWTEPEQEQGDRRKAAQDRETGQASSAPSPAGLNCPAMGGSAPASGGDPEREEPVGVTGELYHAPEELAAAACSRIGGFWRQPRFLGPQRRGGPPRTSSFSTSMERKESSSAR